MIRSIPRSLLLRSISRTSLLNFNRPVAVAHRQYAKKGPSSSNEQPISDFIASQSTPTNSETPSDWMPHQNEEDIAMEKIFNQGTTTGNEDGTPAEGVPVEDVFKGDPAAMDKAPQVIKGSDTSVKAKSDTVPDQESPAHSGMPHVTEEAIATERIMTGKAATGASNSTPGEETPAEGVPVEEVIGDWEKPAIMEESAKDDDEAPPGGQNVRNEGQQPLPAESTNDQDALDPTETARKSILDLFGPASGKKTRQPQSSPPSEPVKQQNFNPLSAHQLDESEIDLSAWEEALRKEEKISHENLDPDQWADTKRGSWETEEVAMPQKAEDELDTQLNTKLPTAQEIQATYKDRPRDKGFRPFDLKLPQTETRPISPYDYFYPPPPPPEQLDTLLRRGSQKRSSDVQRRSKEPVYDPFAAKKKQVKWPWILNRDQLVESCTNHLMRHGKKATAEKILQDVFLRILAQYPRRHPVTLLAEAIDKNAPLLKNTTIRVSMKQTIVPFALNEKQRIRVGWTSMIRAASKGEERISPFTERLTNEVIKAFEGRGAGQQNRIAEHKKAMQNKLNVKVPKAMRR